VAAAESAERNVELRDRRVYQPALLALLGRARPRDGVGEVDEQLQVLGEKRGSVADRLFRRHRAVGPDLDQQAVVVGRLTDTGLLDREVGLLDRREDGIDRDDPRSE